MSYYDGDAFMIKFRISHSWLAMKFHYENHNDQFLEVVIEGRIDPGEAPTNLPSIFAHANELGAKYILLNMTEASLNESLEDSFEIISNFEKFGLPRNYQLAIAFTKDVVQMHFLQTFTAIKKMGNIAFFRSYDDAVNWINSVMQSDRNEQGELS